MSFNNVINEYLKYFLVIGNMSVCKSTVKFVMFLTSLIIKSAQPFEKIHIFFIKFWVFYNRMEPFFYLFMGNAWTLFEKSGIKHGVLNYQWFNERWTIFHPSYKRVDVSFAYAARACADLLACFSHAQCQRS